MATLTKRKFYEGLLKAKKLSRKDLETLDAEAKKGSRSIDELLIEKNYFTPDTLAEFRSELLGIPRADLSTLIDPGVFEWVSEVMATNLGVLAMKKDRNNLLVAMADPEDLEAINFIENRTKLRVVPQYASRRAIAEAVQRLSSAGPAAVAKAGEAPPDIGASVIRLVDNIIESAIKAGASDIHIEPQEKDLLVRYRVDGILHDVMNLSKTLTQAVVARVKVLANLRLDEHRLPQDGRFKKEALGRKFSFRVSVMPVFDGEKIVLRILEEEAKIFTLVELGFTADQQEIVTRNILKPFGMILSTGPTGSGKTTTLYTLLQMLNKREVNISTIEDPIEYRMPGVNQTQVKPEVGLTFANGLRSLLRQDPNTLMVGEIRDSETAGLAIHAALTGHIVLSTLHTNNAAGALPRLLDMKAEGFLIASTASLIIAQRLVRRLCPTTKVAYKLSSAEVANLGKSIDLEGILKILRQREVVPASASWEDITWYRPQPGKDCPDGYKGRIAIAECLEVTDRIRAGIVEGAPADQIEKVARQERMLTMQEVGFLDAAQGITSIEEVLRATKE